MDNIIDWLQEWTKNQVDGDWEHQKGIKIDMYDNPGWFLEVDVSYYGDFLTVSDPLGRDNDEDWIDFTIKKVDNQFTYYVYLTISGDLNKLNIILHSFKAIIETLEEIEKTGNGILSSERIREIINSTSNSL